MSGTDRSGSQPSVGEAAPPIPTEALHQAREDLSVIEREVRQ